MEVTTVAEIRTDPMVLSLEEQEIWDELVNTSEFTSETSMSSKDSYSSLTQRPCCQLKIKSCSGHAWTKQRPLQLCDICGFSREHIVLSHDDDMFSENLTACESYGEFSADKEKCDNFGNTPTYFLAASRYITVHGLMTMDVGGVNIFARNSHGQSFMHVLNHDALFASSSPEDYTVLFAWLSHKKFDFCQSDYYGRRIVEQLVDNLLRQQFSDKMVPTTIMATLYQFEVEDVSTSLNKLRELTLAFSTNSNIHLIWPIITQLMVSAGYIMKGSFAVLGEGDRAFAYPKDDIAKLVQKFGLSATAIDQDGDTLLISILKYWGDESKMMDLKDLAKIILEHGAEIHTRDRAGDTVLSIACRRGFRPIVKFLLGRGANIHARNGQGQGILVQCSRCLRKAQSEGNDGHYPKVLSCVNAVIDAGEKLHPTEIDEWSLPQSARKD